MEERIDSLQSVLVQRMGPEEAAQFQPKHLDSMARAGFGTATMIGRSSRQKLEKIGLPVGQILTLADFFNIPGNPSAPPGQVLSLIECCMDALCHFSHL